MPTPRKLPDDATLKKLYADGKTTIEIAATYGSTPGAVSAHWSRLGLDPRRSRHNLLLPWRVSSEHTHTTISSYLRLLSRLGAGEEVKDRRAGSAWRWAEKQQADGHAVHYTERGWLLLPRTDADEVVTLKCDRQGADDEE